jgi:dTDP-4-amino-4,6-dideoxygalactose transaminase
VAKEILEERYCAPKASVPFVDLKTEHYNLRNDLRKIWEAVLDDAAFVGGRRVEEFESSFAQFCGARHAVGVANGTDALFLALKASGIGDCDEVLVPSNSFVATAEAIVHAGATPVFLDIDPRTYNIDPAEIDRHVTPDTKAIVPVHLYGQPANMDPVLEVARQYELKVIEDAAQAHGARYEGRRAGSMGDAACFSFYPAKNLGACGDGGAIVTNDEGVAMTLRKLRDHGGLKKYKHDLIGYNSRLDNLQASILSLKLKTLDQRNELRRQHAAMYNRLLAPAKSITTPFVPERIEPVYHLYVIRVGNNRRAGLQQYLLEHGVETGIHYPQAIPQTRAFQRFSTRRYPVAEQYAEQILSLPMYPELESGQVEYVANLVCDYMDVFEGRQ